MRMVAPISWFMVVMISNRFLDALESSAPVGSSARSRDCPATMARAQAVRCFWPPDSYAKRVLFLKDGRVFNELLRGERGRPVFYHEILDVLAALGGDVPQPDFPERTAGLIAGSPSQ